MEDYTLQQVCNTCRWKACVPSAHPCTICNYSTKEQRHSSQWEVHPTLIGKKMTSVVPPNLGSISQIISDGGSTSYYQLPPSAKELNDLIEHKAMSFALGNIFKACYRFGEKADVDKLYDINKIIFFAERIKAQLGPK